MPERRIAEEAPGARSLDELYRAHSPQLGRHCMRLTGGNRDAADDLMQEVFTRFIARFPEPPVDMNVGGYLHAMAKNLLWKQLRDRHDVPDERIEESIGADEDIEIDPERAALLGEQRSQVQRCAALLTGHQQRALTLREVEGRSYAEIGGTLGLGADAVAQVIARGRARLRVVMRRAQIDPDKLAPECRALIAPLSAYLDNHAAGSKEITDHLAECDSCRATVASMQEAGFRLRGLAPFAPIAAAFARVGEVVRAGLDGPAGLTAGSLAVAGALAVTGGGALVAQQLTSSQAAKPIVVIGPRHVTTAAPAPATTATPAVATPAPATTVTARPVQTPALTPVYRPSYLTPPVASPARLTPVYQAPAHAPAATTTPATTPGTGDGASAPVTTSQAATPQLTPSVARTTPTTPQATTPEATTPEATTPAVSTPAATTTTAASDTGAAAKDALTPVVGAVKTVVGKVLGTPAPTTTTSVPSAIPDAATPAVKTPSAAPSSTTTPVSSQIPNATSGTTPALTTPPVSIPIKIG
jgi:RNA polymerase sigma factor (sigma-70 family)